MFPVLLIFTIIIIARLFHPKFGRQLFSTGRHNSIPSATPKLPLIGNAKSFRASPVQYLLSQRAIHGDVFTLHLGFINIVFFLGPEGTNAILSGTERTGISLFSAVTYFFGTPFERGTIPPGKMFVHRD